MRLDFSRKIKSLGIKAAIAVFAVAYCSLFTVQSFAQGGSQHYKSPLYSPRTYGDDVKAVSSNGLPKDLDAVGIEQKLNESLPLDLKFTDENGREVLLGDYFGKGRPVILAPVYYECPMLCNEVLNGLTRGLKPLAFNPGKEFDIVAFSFDPREKSAVAKAKKETYLANYNRQNTESGWHFLTGTPESIDKLTAAVGFKYNWDEKSNQFAHAGGVMMATPEGKLSRYFYGIEYAPKELKLGLIESSNSKIGSPVDQLMLYCYHYDPATGKYGFAVMNAVRFGGVLTIFGMAAMLLVLWRYKGGKRVETA